MILSLTKVFQVLFLLTILPLLSIYTTININFTTLSWGLFSIMLLLAVKLKALYFNKINDNLLILPIKLLLIWNIISITRGVFIADNYWEWKNLIRVSFTMLLPVFVYIFTNKKFVQELIKFWLKYGLIIFILLFPFIKMLDFYGSYLVVIMLLLLLFPGLPFQWKVIALLFASIVFYGGLGSRSNIIRFSVAELLGLLYYVRAFMTQTVFKFIHGVLILLPIILLLLGLLNVFNIFKMNQYIHGNYKIETDETGKRTEIPLTADTRTFIYVETMTSAIKNNYWIEGRTPALGYDSKYFGGYLKWTLGTGLEQRFSSEVSILNIFTWTGLIGVFLYFLVFLHASYLAIYKSNNFFIKVLGLFVAFRWAYSFVEDFTRFDYQYIGLWLVISMCYSTEFRNMDNTEFLAWVRGSLPKLSYK